MRVSLAPALLVETVIIGSMGHGATCMGNVSELGGQHMGMRKSEGRRRVVEARPAGGSQEANTQR